MISFDCIVTSSSEIVVLSPATITLPVQFSGFIMIQPTAIMILKNTAGMQSLQISPTRTGQPAILSFLLPAQANLYVAASVSSGVLVTFDSCPVTKSFLNISSSDDIDWNCASSFFSGTRPSFLHMLGSARLRIGWLRSIRINAALPAQSSTDFVSNTEDAFKAYWSNVFNIQNEAAAMVASNMLLDYSSPICYRPPSLSIILFQTSSMLIQGSSALMFGVATTVYNSAALNVAAETSYLQSVTVRSNMSVDAGSCYVSDGDGDHVRW
jgi:hypothetical protein